MTWIFKPFHPPVVQQLYTAGSGLWQIDQACASVNHERFTELTSEWLVQTIIIIIIIIMLDIQNYGCNGNLLCYHGVVERNRISSLQSHGKALLLWFIPIKNAYKINKHHYHLPTIKDNWEHRLWQTITQVKATLRLYAVWRYVS